MYTHWQWHIDRVEHYKAINWTVMEMDSITPYNEDDDYFHSYPLEYITEFNIGDYGITFVAEHPSGLKFQWGLDDNDEDSIQDIITSKSSTVFMTHLMERLPDDHKVELANYLYFIKKQLKESADKYRANLYKCAERLDKLQDTMNKILKTT